MPQRSSVDPILLRAWVQGWSLARSVAAPTAYGEGYRVDVGWPEQKVRYVFPALSEALIELGRSIQEPWQYLKVCASQEELKRVLSLCWVLQPPRYFMMRVGKAKPQRKGLPKNYIAVAVWEEAVFVVRISAPNGDIAAIGRMVFTEGCAVYDRIETHPSHRRLGLASIVMQTLQNTAMMQGVNENLLVATEEGKVLYQSLGWKVLSPYASAVIPG